MLLLFQIMSETPCKIFKVIGLKNFGKAFSVQTPFFVKANRCLYDTDRFIFAKNAR